MVRGFNIPNASESMRKRTNIQQVTKTDGKHNFFILNLIWQKHQ